MRLIKRIPDVTLNGLAPVKEFWDADVTIEHLVRSQYLGAIETWPDVLQKYKDNRTVMSAIGGCISYLDKLRIFSKLQ
jgi:DNA mismatch repair protein MSH6